MREQCRLDSSWHSTTIVNKRKEGRIMLQLYLSGIFGVNYIQNYDILANTRLKKKKTIITSRFLSLSDPSPMLSEPQKAGSSGLWAHRGRRFRSRGLLLPGADTAQHTRHSGHVTRIQGRQEVLQEMCHWTHQSWILLRGEEMMYWFWNGFIQSIYKGDECYVRCCWESLAGVKVASEKALKPSE